MDYKKKYEEALDNFKKIKAANKDNKELVDFIEYNYPELKESEDEKIRKTILELVKQSSDILNPMNQKSMIDWLEKQGAVNKRKQGEQKPAWSEEDERFFKNALWHISYSISNGKSTNIHCDTTDWLKSLKERYAWKPSDEQIIALRWVLNNVPYNKHKEEISGLLEQIKKL